MKKILFLSTALLLIGCSAVNENTTKIKNFYKCYIEKIPAPFWVCYQSIFMSVGKVYTEKATRLKQEEAYSIAVNNLISKFQNKTKIFLKKANIEDKSILKDVKSFVIVNAIEDNTWYDKKHHILYVEAKIDEKEFKSFLKNRVKVKNFEKLFNETF